MMGFFEIYSSSFDPFALIFFAKKKGADRKQKEGRSGMGQEGRGGGIDREKKEGGGVAEQTWQGQGERG